MTLRRELMGYLGTGTIGAVAGYYAGVQGLLGIQSSESATETPAATETPTETATPAPSDQTVVDGFEDGDTAGWSPAPELTSTFEASSERTFAGDWAARFAEGSASDQPTWERSGETVRPTTVETAHALENGEIYSDTWTEWFLGDTSVLRVNYNWSNGFIAVNGSGARASENSGAVVADVPWPSSSQYFHVVLDGIDWENNRVGTVRVNGEQQATDVDFFNGAEGIDRTTVRIGGGGGNVVFIDETTVPEE